MGRRGEGRFQGGVVFEEGLGVGEILEALGAAAGGIGAGAELFVEEEIGGADKAEGGVVDLDGLGVRDGGGEEGIVGELDGGLVGCEPSGALWVNPAAAESAMGSVPGGRAISMARTVRGSRLWCCGARSPRIA